MSSPRNEAHFVSVFHRDGDTVVSTCQRAGLPEDDTVGFINGNHPQHFVTSIGVGSSSILGGGKHNIHCDTAICAACMNINIKSRG